MRSQLGLLRVDEPPIESAIDVLQLSLDEHVSDGLLSACPHGISSW